MAETKKIATQKPPPPPPPAKPPSRMVRESYGDPTTESKRITSNEKK
ncbi:TPA: hypothetical protein ACXRW3_003220 [Klebsiella quasipneumoniae subsp. quasipneumoniae]|nr:MULTISPECIES: hypothetical protein [Klebsiella]EIX9702213.1 hypothetical protein [Klebsiella pneumoniae]EKZ9842387.1 hypothetical protein [Klebsiella pneumoniae]HBW2079241.1 hypothetical protein [Klebsiella pneumoniae]